MTWTPYQRVEEALERFKMDAEYTQPHIDTYRSHAPDSPHLQPLIDFRDASILAELALRNVLKSIKDHLSTRDSAHEEEK